MVLIIILVSFIPMFLVSSVILYQFQSAYREKVHAHLGTLVKKHKINIDTFLKERLADIRLLARTFTYEELSDESFLRDRLDALQQEYAPVFVDLGVINSSGLQVAYAGPFKLGKALYSEAEWFQNAMKTKYFVSDVFLGLRGLPHFIVAVKENYNGEPWILRATIDFVAFNMLVENIRIGETGFAFILNRKGEFQTKPYLQILPEKEPYMALLRSEEIIEGDEVRIVERSDATGKKSIFVEAFMKNGDWFLVYQQDASDAYSRLQNAMKLAIVIILLSGFGIMSVAFVVSKRMVRRIRRADEETQMMNEQIIETGKLASVGELAAGIAHEINNPVAIMVEEAGWIGDLLEEEEFQEGKNLDEFRGSLEQIKNQGKRCKDITQKLLSFARKADSRIEDVKINDLIKEIVDLSAQRAKYANVKINTILDARIPRMRLSQSELQQVLLNLINNAFDAMDNKGGLLKITTSLDGEEIVIGVSDTGRGIPTPNITRVFDPFFTTKPVGKGTGLGLSIVYGIVKKMGGDIQVHSNVDAGTTFRITLPASIHLPTTEKADEKGRRLRM
jgi:two-component system NtrC family sensor kinase